MKKIPTFPDFTHKLVSVSLVGESHAYALGNPRMEMQGGRLFLVGTVPPGGASFDWSEGAVTAVAWDQVNNYLVFESAKDYRKRLTKFRKHKKHG